MLVFLDGQAHYDTSRIGLKYTTVDATACSWSVVAEGRFGNAIKRVSTANTASGYLTIAPLTTRLGPWTPTASGVCGFAVKVDDLSRVKPHEGESHVEEGLFCVQEGNDFHVKVTLNQTGTFTLRANSGLGSNDVILAQSVEGLTSGAWMFVEFKWLIHSSTGTFQIRVNGVQVLDFTGNVREQSLAFESLGVWTSVRLLGCDSQLAPFLTMRMCDLYLADLNSADPDDVSDFLGDGIIETIMPNGVGASTGWTPTGAATNWDATNDRPAPDDDATYVRATATGTKDLYQFEDIPAGSVVKGIHVNILARKEEEGSSSLAPLVRQGSTDYYGATQGVASITYDRYLTQAWDLNPATGAKFTADEINTGQWGVEKMV